MLARLGLTDERAASLTRDLNTILEHMSVLAKVDTSGASEVAGVGAAGMRLRADKGPSVPLHEPPASFAPEMRDGLFIVPRLATHEDTGSA
jgi:aspartyl/glutamyl-tRNA(Asn/Gln) amidotransferase C subunit